MVNSRFEHSRRLGAYQLLDPLHAPVRHGIHRPIELYFLTVLFLCVPARVFEYASDMPQFALSMIR